MPKSAMQAWGVIALDAGVRTMQKIDIDIEKSIFDANVYIESNKAKLDAVESQKGFLLLELEELNQRIAFYKKQIKTFTECKKTFEELR